MSKEHSAPAVKDTTWEAFLEQLTDLQNSGRKLLFRGHANSAWRIETTLERRGHREMLVTDYYRIVSRIRPQIEVLTGESWDVPPYAEVDGLLQEYDRASVKLGFEGLPGYRYLIHGRHHGFPSPLLDWTRSPYIAAQFAFSDQENRDVPFRSVYAWAQPDTWVGGTDQPELLRLGPYVAAHRRHFLQQCDYTVCLRYSTTENAWRFVPHLDAPALSFANTQTLWRFDVRSGERLRVLKFLDAFNLNPFSLFESEESLMETAATRELDSLRVPLEYPPTANEKK